MSDSQKINKPEISRREAIDMLLASGMDESRARWAVNGADSINTSDDLDQLRYTPQAIREALRVLVHVAQEDADRANKILAEYRNAIEEFCECRKHR